MTARQHPHDCGHADVRCVDHLSRRSIACFVCGRLFGSMNDVGFFVAYNPSEIPRRFRAATADELDRPPR